MDRLQTFENFLMNQSVQVDAISFTLNLALAALLAAILGVIYIRYGRALSNRRSFARNFVIMAVTTLFVITVVKSSLALSLGLVGALSIVRFRTAIKDPEELLYLFTTIAIGLGLGADQRIITLIAFAGIVFVLWLQAHFRSKGQDQNLYVTIESTSKHQQLGAVDK